MNLVCRPVNFHSRSPLLMRTCFTLFADVDVAIYMNAEIMIGES